MGNVAGDVVSSMTETWCVRLKAGPGEARACDAQTDLAEASPAAEHLGHQILSYYTHFSSMESRYWNFQ